jgi:PPOX class probable F420-dependent enzyme
MANLNGPYLGVILAEIPAKHAGILDTKALALVATIDKHGGPQTSAVWFGWDGLALTFSTTRVRAKCRNIERDPRISVLVIDPDDPYRYLEMRGRATVRDDPEGALIEEMSQRYEGKSWNGSSEGRVIVSLEPTKVIAY